jgi:hypothetical protein
MRSAPLKKTKPQGEFGPKPDSQYAMPVFDGVWLSTDQQG